MIQNESRDSRRDNVVVVANGYSATHHLSLGLDGLDDFYRRWPLAVGRWPLAVGRWPLASVEG